jgi:hypothetical protein
MKQEYLKRVTLVQQDIYSTVYTSNASNRLYINEIMNTLIALVQAPVFFALYRANEKNRNCIDLIYSSTRQKRIRDVFEKTGECEGCTKCNNCEGTYISLSVGGISGLRHYVRVVRTSPNGGDYDTISVKKSSKEAIDQYIWETLEYLFRDVDKSWNHLLTRFNRATFWQTIFDSIPSDDFEKSHTILRRPVLNLVNNNILRQSEALLGRHLASSFSKLEKTSDFIKDIYGPSEISNYFMMVNLNIPDIKRFSRPDTVENINCVFKYSLAMILSPQQSEEMKSYLSKLKITGKSAYIGKIYGSFNGAEPENSQLIQAMDDWFWEMVENGQVAELVDHFKSHLSEDAQSFGDIVVESGVSYIRFPYENSGIHRIKNSNLLNVNSSECITVTSEHKRIVVTHYLLSAMAPRRSRNNRKTRLIILLNPVEVGGAVWAVVGHMLYVDHDFTKTNQEWYAKFNYITTVRRKIARNIRKRVQEIHLQEIENIYLKTFLKLIEHGFKAADGMATHFTYRLLQKFALQEIKRTGLFLYSPYRIPIFCKKGEFELSQGLLRLGVLTFNWGLLPSFYEQSQFRERVYIPKYRVKEALDRAFRGAILRDFQNK